jgi:hypothetical protein
VEPLPAYPKIKVDLVAPLTALVLVLVLVATNRDASAGAALRVALVWVFSTRMVHLVAAVCLRVALQLAALTKRMASSGLRAIKSA